MQPNNEAAETGLCTMKAHDADRHARNLTHWRQEYDQISCGHFYGRLDELELSHVQVFKEHTSQALRQQCSVWPNGLWLGIPAVQGKESSRINGLLMDTNDIFCRPGGYDFELVTPVEFDIFGIVIDQQALNRTAEIQGIKLWEAAEHQCPRLAVPAKTLQRVRLLLDQTLNAKELSVSPELQQEAIILALMELLHEKTPNVRAVPSFRHRQFVVNRVKQYINEYNDAPITMSDLCRLTNVSRRTLQYSFESIVGVSPMQFLRMTRLNRVRRSLSAGSGTAIADIAAYWGFWHGGQFAKDYKKLFGEAPSETQGKALRGR
ncbi:AraC family transcriptional regulator [Halovibrio salipaludis]|uniref:AraC family transcriptional regulator n=1 Tax=Halovibrio salipaludis TaxID=2032626 RepID=A0A2A2FBM5_9GAMM|nr:helix-turn-helix domain-containing protein [Halovibrio salipaludis]PAU82114.1 AraC family transcriptional regulator [Halovibrio salipaludis]